MAAGRIRPRDGLGDLGPAVRGRRSAVPHRVDRPPALPTPALSAGASLDRRAADRCRRQCDDPAHRADTARFARAPVLPDVSSRPRAVPGGRAGPRAGWAVAVQRGPGPVDTATRAMDMGLDGGAGGGRARPVGGLAALLPLPAAFRVPRRGPGLSAG